MTPLTITVAEAARLAGVHRTTIWRWARAGCFSMYAPQGKRLVDYGEFERFIKGNRVYEGADQ